MADDRMLDQAQLQGLVRAQSAFELVAEPVKINGKTCWTMDVVIASGERLKLCKTRSKAERKVWKQLTAVHRFVAATVPEVERFTVLSGVRSLPPDAPVPGHPGEGI